MPDKVTAENKKKRLYELQDLQKSIQLRNNKQLVGKELDVLITGNNPKIEGEVIEEQKLIGLLTLNPVQRQVILLRSGLTGQVLIL